MESTIDTVNKFMEMVINKIKTQGVLGNGYSNEERERDVINMVEDTYQEYISQKTT